MKSFDVQDKLYKFYRLKALFDSLSKLSEVERCEKLLKASEDLDGTSLMKEVPWASFLKWFESGEPEKLLSDNEKKEYKSIIDYYNSDEVRAEYD